MNISATHGAVLPARELLIADQADLLLLKSNESDFQTLINVLSPHHKVHVCGDVEAAVSHVIQGKPVDLIMIDVARAGPAERQLCRRLRQLPSLRDIPIVFLTQPGGVQDFQFGAAAGLLDFIEKPLSPALMLARVANHVSHGRVLRLLVDQNDALDHRVSERTEQLARRNQELQDALRQLAKTQDVTIIAFSSLAETRDNETGRHLRRTQHYVRELALTLRDNRDYASELDDETINLIFKSAPLHDIRRVAIPDHILLKKGNLDSSEFAIMKTHAEHGFRVIASAEAGLGEYNSFLHIAREIAYGHHEKWDGSGYPNGHAGIEIPLSARLMALADVYDALISKRVYKPSLTHGEAIDIIARGRAAHFDPAIVDAFIKIHPSFARIASELCDTPTE